MRSQKTAAHIGHTRADQHATQKTTSCQMPPGEIGHNDKQLYRLPFIDVVHDLDAFWRRIFAAASANYRTPVVKTLAESLLTACGPAGPEHLAFYCPAEETIYYAPVWLTEHGQRIGDFAPVVVLAHEWGHHIQTLLSIDPVSGNAFELQADCLAGAYASDAATREILDPGDITEAVILAASVGDPLGIPQDAPGAHGINDDRISAFMRGYLQGVMTCNGRHAALSSVTACDHHASSSPP